MVEDYYQMIYKNDSATQYENVIDHFGKIFNEYGKGASSPSLSHDYIASIDSKFNCYVRDKYPQDEGFDILQW